MTPITRTTSDRHSLARSLRVMAAAGNEVQLTMTSDQARALAADLDRLGIAPVVARKIREQLG